MIRNKISIPRIKRGLIHLKKLPLYLRRLKQLNNDENLALNVNLLTKHAVPRVFNLDLHIGVIADLEQELAGHSIELTRWSISMHNHLVSGRLPITDPVRYVNSRKWHLLNESIIYKFQNRYQKFLKSFDGFISTYSPVFAELYRGFNKPILIVAATRYEAPYTNRQGDWDRFNKYLISGVKNSEIFLHANNKGDADYLSYFTGIKVQTVPSLCEKGKISHEHEGRRVIISNDQKLVHYIESSTRKLFNSISVLGIPYLWTDLIHCKEILVFPQNISTMTLFELATAGVPVAVPSRRWVKELLHNGYLLLNELSFHQILGLDTSKMSPNNPGNYNSASYLDWWLDRADFYSSSLMPNVRIVDSIEELVSGQNDIISDLNRLTELRNVELKQKRHAMIKNFKESM